jgi:hypothetical protein
MAPTLFLGAWGGRLFIKNLKQKSCDNVPLIYHPQTIIGLANFAFHRISIEIEVTNLAIPVWIQIIQIIFN